MNNAILCGNLGNNWELIKGEYGIVAKNSIAITKKYTKNNVTKEKTQWIQLVAFNKQAETLAQYSKKGDKLLIRGEIQINDYENNQGKTKTNINIKIEEFTLLGTKTNPSLAKENIENETKKENKDI